MAAMAVAAAAMAEAEAVMVVVVMAEAAIVVVVMAAMAEAVAIRVDGMGVAVAIRVDGMGVAEAVDGGMTSAGHVLTTQIIYSIMSTNRWAGVIQVIKLLRYCLITRSVTGQSTPTQTSCCTKI